MPDDVAARALAKELMGVPSMGTPQQIETQFTFLLTAALHAERQAVWGRAYHRLVELVKRADGYVEQDVATYLEWCRAQAEKEV